MGDPESFTSSTPSAPLYPQEYTEPSSVTASECREPQLIEVILLLRSLKETFLGSSLSELEDCPSLPSSLSPAV
jgi:hypothetical protein